MESNNRKIFFQKTCRKWGRDTSSKPLFVFWKGFIWGKSKWFGVYCQYISIVLNLAYDKNKLYKTLNLWSRDMLNFCILEKDLGIISPPHFVYDLSTKMFPVLYSSSRPNFIVWLPLLLEILGNMCIAFVC